MRHDDIPVLGLAVMLIVAPKNSFATQPIWRLNVEQRFVLDDGPAQPIKDLRDFAVGLDGRLYVLENTVKQVHVYLPNGRYSKTFSRSGSGPGEIRDANGIIMGPDGSFWVNDYGNARITNFSKDGTLVRQLRSSATGYAYRWSGFIDTDGRLHDELFGTQQESFERHSIGSRVVDTLKSAPCPGNASTRKSFFRAQNKSGASMGRTIPFVQRVAHSLRRARCEVVHQSSGLQNRARRAALGKVGGRSDA